MNGQRQTRCLCTEKCGELQAEDNSALDDGGSVNTYYSSTVTVRQAGWKPTYLKISHSYTRSTQPNQRTRTVLRAWLTTSIIAPTRQKAGTNVQKNDPGN